MTPLKHITLRILSKIKVNSVLKYNDLKINSLLWICYIKVNVTAIIEVTGGVSD